MAWMKMQKTEAELKNGNRAASNSTTGGRGARAAGKRSEILAVAQRQFLAHGFDGTTIDSIVDLVGGSKTTIYSYFGSKEELFAAVIRTASHDADTPDAPPDFPVTNGNVRDELMGFAADRLARVMSPLNIGIMRMVIAEAGRMPGLAEMFYSNAPEPTYRALEAYLEKAAGEGRVRIDNAAQASEQFLGALLQKLLLARLFATAKPPSKRAVQRRAADVVDSFLSVYPASQ